MRFALLTGGKNWSCWNAGWTVIGEHRMEGQTLHLPFFDFLAGFLVLRFSVRTHEPPRMLNFDLSVGTIVKCSFLNSPTISLPSSLVVKKSVLTIPFSRLRRGPAFLQLQLTQLYLWRLRVYSELGHKPVISVEIFKNLFGLTKTWLHPLQGERSSSSLKVTVP